MCPLTVCIKKFSAPVSALTVYPVSALTYAHYLYTVECTQSVHWTSNAQWCVDVQRRLHVYCATLRALKEYTAHVLRTCSEHFRYTVRRCVVSQRTMHVPSVPVSSLTTYTAPALCPCECIYRLHYSSTVSMFAFTVYSALEQAVQMRSVTMIAF